MKRALITGGAGFIGSHLADALIARGVEVTLFDLLDPQVHPRGAPSWLPRAARLIKGDVRDPRELTPALAGVDVVFHLAAQTGTGQSMHEVGRYVETNVDGVASLIGGLARTAPRPLVVLASSRAIHGEGEGECPSCGRVQLAPRTLLALAAGRFEPECPRCSRPCATLPMDESTPARPTSIYGVTKLAQEEMLRVAAENGLACVRALRLQNIYGARQALGNPYTGLLAVFANRLRQGLRCELFEDGLATRDLLHVSDAVDALLFAADDGGNGGASGGEKAGKSFDVFAIGSGKATTLLEIGAAVTSAVVGDRPDLAPVITGRFRAGDVRHARADVRRAQTILGFAPRTGFDAGVRDLVEWARAQPPTPDRSALAQGELERRGLGGARVSVPRS